MIYMGSSSGDVLEYDGVNWRHILTSMTVIRAVAPDSSGRVWVGGNGNFGYLAPDAMGKLQFVSLLNHVKEADRSFTDAWQVLPTSQGVFFRSYQLLFRWDGKNVRVWRPALGSKFQALDQVDGRIYTSQDGVGLQEIVGDELRDLPGGEAYKGLRKIFMHPYDAGRMIISDREGSLRLYDGQRVVPFSTGAEEYLKTHQLYTSTHLRDGGLCVTTLNGGVVVIDHDGKLRQIIDKADGLLDSGGLSVFEDREGALWIGTGDGVSRVEANSPLSMFSTSFLEDAIRFNGIIYGAQASGADSVERLTSEPKTNRPTFERVSGATQTFMLRAFHDLSGKTPDQLLVATSEGVLRVEGDKLVPTTPLFGAR